MPDIRERLGEDLKAAMRAKAQLRLSTIRMVRSEIQYKDKEHGKETDEEDILKLLQSMVKKREEAAELYTKGGGTSLRQRSAKRSVSFMITFPLR